jgi:hypothetical protein
MNTSNTHTSLRLTQRRQHKHNYRATNVSVCAQGARGADPTWYMPTSRGTHSIRPPPHLVHAHIQGVVRLGVDLKPHLGGGQLQRAPLAPPPPQDAGQGVQGAQVDLWVCGVCGWVVCVCVQGPESLGGIGGWGGTQGKNRAALRPVSVSHPSANPAQTPHTKSARAPARARAGAAARPRPPGSARPSPTARRSGAGRRCATAPLRRSAQRGFGSRSW